MSGPLRTGLQTFAIALAVACPLLATLEDPGMAWDEGYTVERADKVRSWFAELLRRPRRELFRPRWIDRFWPFAREEPDGHPPVYAMLALAGHAVAEPFLPPLSAWRLGAALLWTGTLSATFVFLRRRLNVMAAATAVLLVAWCPRLFAHAHFALYDVPLASFWLISAMLTWKAFEAARYGWSRAFLCALGASATLAAAAATKFTGWLIPLPLLGGALVAIRASGAPVSGGTEHGRTGLLGNPMVLLALTLLPLLIAAPETFRLIREAHRLDSHLRASPETLRGDQRRIPRLVGERFRADYPARFSGWSVFGAGPLLATFALLRRKIRGAGHRFDVFDYLYVLAGFTPLFTLCLVPSWWPDPLQRLALFFWSNLTRRETTWIPTLFLGRTYDYSLPWYNTLVWTFVAMPPLTLALALRGAFKAARPGTTAANLLSRYLLLHASCLLVVRALPGAPGHDGIRQLLPSIVFLGLLAGPALYASNTAPTTLAHRILPAAAVIWSAAATTAYHPVQLSYYSELVGGLPGASRLGFEPTYYWDAFDSPVRQWLEEHTFSHRSVAFSSLPLSFHYLKEWGYLRVPIAPIDPFPPQWYVLLNRPGLFKARPVDGWLARHGTPAFVRSRFGVPLIWVFPIEEVDRAHAARGHKQAIATGAP